jgi:hypothetical protein
MFSAGFFFFFEKRMFSTGAVLVRSAGHAKAHLVELGPILAPSPTYYNIAMRSFISPSNELLADETIVFFSSPAPALGRARRGLSSSEAMVMKPTNHQTIHLDHALVLVHLEGHE